MKPKILVVDDEESMQTLLRDTLSIAGFEVDIAKDDEEFRQQVFKKKPDIIILDIVLGEKDGAQIYEELLTEGLDKNIPVVFISALAEDRPPTPPRADRKFSLIGKPFDPDKLVHDLQKLVHAA